MRRRELWLLFRGGRGDVGGGEEWRLGVGGEEGGRGGTWWVVRGGRVSVRVGEREGERERERKGRTGGGGQGVFLEGKRSHQGKI